MTNQVIEDNKLVKMTYTISADGSVFEETEAPVDYIHGYDNGMHERIRQALAGKKIGDTVRVTLPPEEGFGTVDMSMVYDENINNVPPEYRTLGAKAEFRNSSGDLKSFLVINVTKDKVRFDGNHPLAGKDLLFTLQIIDIRDATEEELAAQHQQAPGDTRTLN